MDHRFYIVDVFSPVVFGGNQLAVFPEADGLRSEAMQQIAREFNFSEATFVTRIGAEQNRFKVRIFTPNSELQFAGHPTIGTACVLAMGDYAGKGDRCNLILEEGVGPIAVDVGRRDDAWHATMTLVGRLQISSDGLPALQDLAGVLSLPADDLLATFSASMGLPFCFVQLRSRDAVDRARLDRAAWTNHLSGSWAPNVFLFAGSPQDGSKLYARMFAPALGIEEDPATGSACAALVAAIAERSDRDGDIRIAVEQGVAMGRRSNIEASARKTDGVLGPVSVGGATAYVATGTLRVPDAG